MKQTKKEQWKPTHIRNKPQKTPSVSFQTPFTQKGLIKAESVNKLRPSRTLVGTLSIHALQQGGPSPSTASMRIQTILNAQPKQNFTTYLPGRWQTKNKLPNLDT
jgi:hypothetical protein